MWIILLQFEIALCKCNIYKITCILNHESSNLIIIHQTIAHVLSVTR